MRNEKNNLFEDIKKEIDLSSYLQYKGFEIDKKKSTKKYQILKNKTNKFIIFKAKNENYKLFKDFNTEKSGSIINYMKDYENKSIKEILKQNSTHINKKLPNPTTLIETKINENLETKLAYIYNLLPDYQPNNIIKIDKYLESRNINPELLIESRFINTIKMNLKYKNLFVPHLQNKKIIGAEIIRDKKKQILKNSQRSNYMTNTYQKDTNLVITESFIDLTSYYTLHNEKLNKLIKLL